jgi:penicillin-binding protein 1A
MAKRLGVGGAWFSPDRHGLSYTLGVLDTSPLDMAAAYSVFANRGERLEPSPIVKVTDSAGKVLIDNTGRKGERALDEIVADNVTALLRGVIDGGTGSAANIGRPAAGKTGSSQFNANAWFVGYTPALSTAIWMGKTDGQGPAQALLRIKGVPRVYGGTIPARTWKTYMTQALKDVPPTDFDEPAPISSITDRVSRAERGGFDPGNRREPKDVTGQDQYEFDIPPPVAEEPTPDTTSTTAPEDDNPPFIFP